MGKKSNLKKEKREGIKKTVLETPEKPQAPVRAPEPRAPEMREIRIETDGTNIKIVKDTSAGKLELLAVLQALMSSLTSPK